MFSWVYAYGENIYLKKLSFGASHRYSTRYRKRYFTIPACVYHGESARYNRGTQLHPYTCKMSEHPPDRRPGRFLGQATARHRIGQPVLLFAKVQKSKLVKNNFIVYFSSICLYFISGCAGDTGLYAPKMSEHLPDLRPSRFFGRTCARHRIGQPVLLFAKVQQKNR